MNLAHLAAFVPALLTALTTLAQQPQLNWDEVHYTGQGTNTGKRVLLGPDTAVYTFGEGGWFCYLAKYRSFDGQPQWTVQWDSATTAVDLVQHPNGMLVTAWVSYFLASSSWDIGVRAFTPEGASLWSFTWNDSLDRNDIVSDLHIDANGDIVLCATSEDNPGNPSDFNNVSVLKLDTAGNLIWRRTWNGANSDDDEPNAIWTDAQSNVFVAGYTKGSIMNNKDLLVLKYNAAGELQWQQIINRNSGFGDHVDIATHVMIDPNGNIVVAGLTESPGSDQYDDISVYRFGQTGNLIDQSHYDHHDELSVSGLDLDAAGRAYVAGRSGAFNGDGEVVFRVDTNGTISAMGDYFTNGMTSPYPYAMVLSNDGNMITTGFVGDQLSHDTYVRSYDSTGTVLWTYHYTGALSPDLEEGRNIAIGANNAIYVCGLYEQSGFPLTKGMTFCLCPADDGVCLLAPTTGSLLDASAIAGADLNQDGWRDLVFTYPGQTSLGVYLGSVNGLTFASSITLPGYPTLLASADIDQDGDLDVVAGSTGGWPDLWVLKNTNGTLTYTGLVSTNSQPVSKLHINDLDGQNGPDIVLMTTTGTGLLVLLNNGSGSFTPSYPTAGPWPMSMTTGDLDANGTVDLLVGDYLSDSVFVLSGDGNGGFGPPIGHYSYYVTNNGLGIADMNFDGIADILGFSGGMWVLLPGSGNGTFAPPVVHGNLGLVNNFVILPFPQDTSFHLLTGNIGSTQKVVYSDCTLTYNSVSLSSAYGTHMVDVADWTNDGSLDILSYSSNGDLRIWRNCDTAGVTTDTPEVLQAMPGHTLTVFPSPTSAQATLLRPTEANGIAEISLWALNGEQMRRWSSTAPIEQLDLSDLAEGVYLVRYATARATWTTRLVIVRGA